MPNNKNFQLSKLPYSFAGVETSFAKAKVVILPFGYEATTSYNNGTKNGPLAIINASRNLELFDEELSTEPTDLGIITLPEAEINQQSFFSPILQLEDLVKDILKDKKFFIVIGGEHSITLGSALALKEKIKNFGIIFFDAHLDARNKYLNNKYSHACIARRIHNEKIPFMQIAIRSFSKEENSFYEKRKKQIITAQELNQNFFTALEKIKINLTNLPENIFISFDIDALDPSIMPSTGTPEPGGLLWYETLTILKLLIKNKNILGCDFLEHCPIANLSAPDFLSAKLIYKTIGYNFFRGF